jgi:hypothetical protein
MTAKEYEHLAAKLTGAPRLIRYDADWDDEDFVK